MCDCSYCPLGATIGTPVTRLHFPVYSGQQKERERDFVDQKTAAVNEQHEAVGNVGTTQPVEEESPDLTHTTASLKNYQY